MLTLVIAVDAGTTVDDKRGAGPRTGGASSAASVKRDEPRVKHRVTVGDKVVVDGTGAVDLPALKQLFARISAHDVIGMRQMDRDGRTIAVSKADGVVTGTWPEAVLLRSAGGPGLRPTGVRVRVTSGEHKGKEVWVADYWLEDGR